MTVKLLNLNHQTVKAFHLHIKNHLKDLEFRSLFLEFFVEDFSQQDFTKQDRTAIHNSFEEFLIILFSNYTIEGISWKNYCLSMKCIRNQNWDNRTRKMARNILSGLYHFIIENVHLSTNNFNEIKENKELLISEERKKETPEANDLLVDKVLTNFPIDSSPNHLELFQDVDKSNTFILNLNISNDEIKDLLLGFYKSETKTALNSLRQFLYLFRYSLMVVDKEPQSITDFTFEVFKKQFRFYKRVNKINIARTYSRSDRHKLTHYLVRFYIYLCNVIREQNIRHNVFEGTHYNENYLSSNHFAHLYEKGYKLIVYNPFEEVPIENRWQLIPSDGYATTQKNRPIAIDFLKVEDISLRNDLKTYVWKQSHMTVNTVGNAIYMIIEFLNFISDYKRSYEVNIDSYIDLQLLEQWVSFIGHKETSTRNNYVKYCKSYLRFFRDKYNIPNLLIDSLKKKPQDFDGGTPITKDDVNLFSELFLEYKQRGVLEELCYIVYNLAVTTKLRVGEIMNLERDCIVEKYEQAGVIQYHSKGSGNQKVREILSIEKINLIEEAITLTVEAHSKANKEIADYIFLKEDAIKNGRIIDFSNQFQRYFLKIQDELDGRLNRKYRPYDLRSTFIDTVYTEGIKDGLQTSVIAEMAGNGIQTARKYYRKASEVQEYAELFAGVTISGVDVYGNILKNEDVEILNPVKEELGGCSQDGCVMDDEQYECLICPYFATTTNRIPLFKKYITRLKAQKESTLNSQERNVIDAQLKLYTAYYSKLLKKMGDEKNSTDA